MSYSFNIKAISKGAAKVAVAEKFDEIMIQQPVHSNDRSAVLANAYAVIDLLAEDNTKDVSVSINGYVSWSGPDNSQFSSVNISAGANHSERSPV